MIVRRAIIECTEEIAALVASGKAGCAVIDRRHSFVRNAFEILVESPTLPPVLDGQNYPLATLIERGDYLTVEVL